MRTQKRRTEVRIETHEIEIHRRSDWRTFPLCERCRQMVQAMMKDQNSPPFSEGLIEAVIDINETSSEEDI